MNQSKFDTVSLSLATDFSHAMGHVIESWYDKEGKEMVNGCFMNALAIAVGTVLAGTSTDMEISSGQRKALYDMFENVWRQTARNYRLWERGQQKLKEDGVLS